MADSDSIKGPLAEWKGRRWVYLALFVFVVLLYARSLQNGYVFDDRPLFWNNRYVMQGIDGIPTLLTTDAFKSQHLEFGVENHLSGGRYRPLSLVTFALEVELFGLEARAWFSHLINVLLYALTGCVMLCFLSRRMFPEQFGLSLFITALFMFHPIHSEVVLNVKSRDEMMCFLFMLLAMLACQRNWFLTALCFLLGLLSKEYAAILLVLIPVWLYVTLHSGRRWAVVLSLWVTFIGYVVLRITFVGLAAPGAVKTILNYPYLYAEGAEKPATLIYVLGLYLTKLFWPYPLAYDYSYNQVPYVTFAHPLVWVAALTYCSLTLWSLNLLKARSKLSLPVLWYLGALFLVSNIFANTGQMIAERFLYVPSFGFAVILGWGSWRLIRRNPVSQRWGCAAYGLVALLAVVQIQARIPDWESEDRLYKHDAEFLTGNSLAHCNAAAKYIDDFYRSTDPAERADLLNKGLHHANHAVMIYPEDEITQLNLGLLHYNLGEYDMAEIRWNIAREFSPGHPKFPLYDALLAEAYFDLAIEAGLAEEFTRAVDLLQRVLTYDGDNLDAQYYLGGAWVELQDFEQADRAWANIKPVTWLGFRERPAYKKAE